MRYFVDTEFIDDGKTIDLISIGIVAEDGRELYLQSCEFDHRNASAWVKENVFTHLLMCPWAEPSKIGIPGLYRADRAYHKKYGGQCIDQQRGRIYNCPWRAREQMRTEVKAFIGSDEKPEIYGWCCSYDWVAVCQLFGTMMDLPANWPHYMRDIQMLLDQKSIDDNDLPKQTETAHNALADARYIKQIFDEVL